MRSGARFSVSKKPRRVRARRREDIEIRFLRRHVRRRKHFSPRKRANCPCSTDSECAAAGCSPFVKKALLQGVPPPAGGGIKFNSVIFGDMRLENDTSHDGWSDFSARNRTPSVMQPLSKKAKMAFFDSLKKRKLTELPLFIFSRKNRPRPPGRTAPRQGGGER